METVIKIENLYKQYRLGQVGTGTISHDLNRWWHKIRGKEDPYLKVGEINDRTHKGYSDYVYALNDINLNINSGDRFAIIGKNGAGKSTLLKILSKVTGPTNGLIRSKGRIAALLEVGTGFHPELTGRENIYMNGTIMGMTRKEINNKMDEIVQFAGVERYIDTPTKRYSSGMIVRLGFSIAAHLEPEILVVDEVLAVGDAEFQKKALGKMEDVSLNDGRTILFVSHNMSSIRKLCTKGIVLEQGQIAKSGDIETIMDYYQLGNELITNNIEFGDRYRNEIVRLIGVCYFQENSGEKIDIIDIQKKIYIKVKYELFSNEDIILIGFALKDTNGQDILCTGDIPGISLNKRSNYGKKIGKGIYEATCCIPENFLNERIYNISIAVNRTVSETYFFVEDILTFSVNDSTKLREVYAGQWSGQIKPHFYWDLTKINE